MYVNRIGAIAINTFREAVRDRVLYGVLGAALAVLLLTLALAELSLGQQGRVVMDLGLASISLFGVVIAIFLGSSLLYKEIEKKTLYIILPKPIHRWEFLVGKFFGIVVTAAVFLAVMGTVQLLVASAQADASTVALVAAVALMVGALAMLLRRFGEGTGWLVVWCLGSLTVSALLAERADVEVAVTLFSLLLSLGEVMVLAAVAMLFSAFSTPFLTGIFCFGVWLVGRSAGEMATMKSTVLPDSVKRLLHLLSEIIPNFHLFVPGRHTLLAEVAEGAGVYAATTMGYAVCYTVLLLVLACGVFRRRDFL